MPRGRPPAEPPQARLVTLPAGATLWRIEYRLRSEDGHRTRYTAKFPEIFNDRYPDDSRWGGRFDPVDTPTPYCYVATDDLTTLAETLLRDNPFDGPTRYLPRTNVNGRNLSLFETSAPLTLVSLSTLPELAAARQDTWLIHAEAPDYVATQLWGDWLRQPTAPAAGSAQQRPDGISWPSKRNPGGTVVVLFADRCAEHVGRSPFGSRRLDDEPGRRWLDQRLSVLSTKLGPRPAETPPPPPAGDRAAASRF